MSLLESITSNIYDFFTNDKEEAEEDNKKK